MDDERMIKYFLPKEISEQISEPLWKKIDIQAMNKYGCNNIIFILDDGNRVIYSQKERVLVLTTRDFQPIRKLYRMVWEKV